MRRGCLLAILFILAAAAPCARGQEQPPASGPSLLLGPRRGAEKEKALRRFGSSSAAAQAVAAGLDWLARHQGADGSWDADGFSARCEAKEGKPCEGVGKGQHGEDAPCPFDHAISALAALAFLGDGHLPSVEGDPHAAVLKRALPWLENGGSRWGFVIATQALAEAEAMEGRGRWRATVHRRARQLLSWRGEDGAWGYYSGYGRGSDVPFTALVVQALVAARDAGFQLSADVSERVDGFLDTLEVKRGRLAYLKDGRRFGYTPTSENAACAAAIRELLQVGTKGARHRMHLALLSRQRPHWKISFDEVVVPGKGKVRVQVGKLSMYRWWYGTVACFQHGGAAWSGWHARLKSALLGSQVKSGCARGSWNPQGLYERQTGGRVFATALGVLMLEEPWRHRRLAR